MLDELQKFVVENKLLMVASVGEQADNDHFLAFTRYAVCCSMHARVMLQGLVKECADHSKSTRLAEGEEDRRHGRP